VFDVKIEDICTPGYSKKVRVVIARLKKEAYAGYGITSYQRGDYKVDHLIPLALGGSNSILNLWPQSTKNFRDDRGKQEGVAVAIVESVPGTDEAEHSPFHGKLGSLPII
jgi:hypothetical protein